MDHETPLRVSGQDDLGGGTLLQGLLGKGRHQGAAGAALLSIALIPRSKHTRVALLLIDLRRRLQGTGHLGKRRWQPRPWIGER